MHRSVALLQVAALALVLPDAAAQDGPVLSIAGFEAVAPATGFAQGWTRGVAAGTAGDAQIDSTVACEGRRSLRISDSTPTEAYRYVLVNSDWIGVVPETTYVIRFHARGRNVGRCFVGAAFEGAGEHRQALPIGDYDWRELTCRVTTPAGCRRLSLQFLADGTVDALWIDNVSLELSAAQLANIAEARSPRAYAGWFPCTPGPVPEHLVVADLTSQSTDTCGLLVALQGLVNRDGPGLYLVNQTNPPRYDDMWLAYMQEKGYTGLEDRLDDPLEALTRFRGEFRGLVVWDPELPGSLNAAWMLAGLLDALPASPQAATRLGLPIVEDLRGRWRRNVEAYRYVYERYWGQMSHHLLAWEYPLSNALSSRDYMVQHRVFMFWLSAYTDEERGADPPAEMEFLEELLSATPGNVPVMGWPTFGGRGIEEYTAVRLLSEYGKWVPGTGYSSNVSVHSAISPDPGVFRQAFRSRPPAAVALDSGKVYISVSILDSGDAHWYWQLYQRGVWADPERGSLPTGYAMNPTLVDVLPLVAEWYYEHMTPNDALFAFLYMNAPVYASRFREVDRERIWGEYVSWLDAYRRRMDMDGIELYCGGTSGPSASAELLKRFTTGMPSLACVLADLGRHTDTTPATANLVLDGKPVFHTLTNFRVWTRPEDVLVRTMESENAWLLDEILRNAPSARPGFMSAMAISWSYCPAWLRDLQSRLPAEYVLVSPGDLARLYREALARGGETAGPALGPVGR